MVGKKKLPLIIRKVGFDFPFDFENDPKKIWTLELPIIEIPITHLTWHLDIPFWASDKGFYDLSPNRLLDHPQLSMSHYQKVLEANLDYPIDYTFYKGKNKIIDGLHRLTKAKILGLEKVRARYVPLKMLLKLINRKDHSGFY